MKFTSLYRKASRKFLGVALAAGAMFAVQVGPVSAESTKLVQSGTIEIDQTQIAFILSGNVGGGTLKFNGKTYPFSIGGLGVGGIGVTQVDASGEVYNLKSLNDFDGAYLQARTGLTVGDNVMKSGLWLENSAGVYIRLKAERKGVALSLGGDAIYIKFD
jgi:hypothetical protein